ncbi:ABC transporter ATP-binding protein [Brachybacterium sp. AOP35-5H-19]|uniref:ABC transporter ATP-binding protein n=1 Tax=Brachybacterium sp. AOP35-5H-19 TaxID=3457685 RepID=UPI004033B777
MTAQPTAAPVEEHADPVPPLVVRGLASGYGGTQILHGVDLTVPAGSGVAVLGRNGMGKTTLLQTIMGFVPTMAGEVQVDGRRVTGEAIHTVARAGLRIVPQGRRVFSSLTVEETLQISARGPAGTWTAERLFDTFPSLAARKKNRSDRLSGGEQEMLVIGRALLGNPTCLLLDEPSDGLAPKIVEQVSEIIVELRKEGVPVVLVEQNLHLAIAAADFVNILARGAIVWSGTVDEFRDNREIAVRHLGVGQD